MDSPALQMEKIKSLDQLLPKRGPAIYRAGNKDNDKGYVLFGPKSSTQPTLIITNPIYDEDRNVILPGYYELQLAQDKSMIYLTQRQETIATVPVFRVEEDKSQLEPSPMNNKALKKFNKEQKKKAKKIKKLIAQGQMIDEPEIYNKASIEYNEDGDYYIIKYERGAIRAWGALKF